MIIACPACETRYVVPDSAIGVDGRTVRCAKCKHSWFQDGASAEQMAAAATAQAPQADVAARPPSTQHPLQRQNLLYNQPLSLPHQNRR